MLMSMLESTFAQKLKELKHSSVKLMRKKKDMLSNTDVLTKLYGIITQCHFLLHLTLQTYVDTENLMIIDGHTLPCYFADSF